MKLVIQRVTHGSVTIDGKINGEINKGYVVPFSHGKLSYKVSSINDYSMPRGTYGLARFKLKGVKATENAITTMERNEMKEAYQEAKSSI